MAKQLVNPIERHAEKAVLAIAGLALIYVIARYVVTTPNSLELGNERVTPSTIDQKVAQKAADAAVRLRSAPPRAEIPDPLYGEFEAAVKPVDFAPLPGAVAFAPEVPLVDRPGVAGGQAALVKLQTPAKPTVSHGRGTLVLCAGGDRKFVPADWASVSAVFDVKAHLDAQKREYGPKGEDLVLGPPGVHAAASNPTAVGRMGDWHDVECSPAVKLPREPSIVLIDEGGKLTVDKDLLKQIDSYYNEIAQHKMQLEIMRPLPPEMHAPTAWSLPIISTYREVQLQDDEYLFPNEAPAPDPMDRYGLSSDAAKAGPAKQLTPEQQRAKDMDDAIKLIAQARQVKSENDATRAFNLMAGIMTDRTASQAEKDRAEKINKDADQALKDIKRELLVGGANPVAQPGGASATTVKKRERRPTQQIWAHDAAPGSLESGGVYQYRIRFRAYNVLAGAPGKFNNPEDAAILFLQSEWSEPSDPVTIEPASLFFVTSEDPKDQEVSVEFFQWYLGVWVKPERRINATIGDTLYDKQRTNAPDLNDPNKADKPEIEFAADATVVDIDFDYPFRDRKAGTSTKGVKFGQPAPSTAVVFMDAQGRLHERFVPIDKSHPDKRKVPVWSPPKAKP